MSWLPASSPLGDQHREPWKSRRCHVQWKNRESVQTGEVSKLSLKAIGRPFGARYESYRQAISVLLYACVLSDDPKTVVLMQSVASDVCKDLILYDSPKENQFRELIPLAHNYPMLLEIIVATSAMRMSHASQKSAWSHAATGLICHSTNPTASQHQYSGAYPQARSHALVAKFKALKLLQSALSGEVTIDLDVVLAVVLLFVEFELLDSGRDNWIHHIDGARKIIEKLCGSNVVTARSMSPLRRCLVSNCLMYMDSPQPHGRPLTLKQFRYTWIHVFWHHKPQTPDVFKRAKALTPPRCGRQPLFFLSHSSNASYVARGQTCPHRTVTGQHRRRPSLSEGASAAPTK
jgi:hypothetical protein